ETDRLLKLADRLVGVSWRQRGPQVAVRVGVIWGVPDGLAKGSDGFLGLTELHVDQAPIVVGLGEIGARPHRLAKGRRCRRRVRSLPSQQAAEDIVSCRAVWLLRNGSSQLRNGGIERRQGGGGGGKIQGALELTHRRVQFTAAEESDTQVHVGSRQR